MKNHGIKNEIKKDLWNIWGSPDYPAEWDGNLFGGGKCSQRFWEYLFVIDNLPGSLDENSIILDVGSGATKFLPNLLRKHCRCLSMDSAITENHKDDIKISFNKHNLALLSEFTITAVTCVSVLEHIPDQAEFISALDLINSPILITFEFGAHPPSFEYQLTLRKVYDFTRVIKNHYVSKFERSPLLADNSDGHWYPLGMVFLPL